MILRYCCHGRGAVEVPESRGDDTWTANHDISTGGEEGIATQHEIEQLFASPQRHRPSPLNPREVTS
jgi:hypothetical protein